MRKKKDNQFYKEKVQQVFESVGRKILNYKQVAARLDVNDGESRNMILAAIKQLCAEEFLEEIDTGRYILKFIPEFVSGKVDMTQNKAAYVIPENGGDDIYIPADYTHTALNGDLVKVALTASKKGGKRLGEIVEIIKRDKTQFVGILTIHAGYGFIVCEDRKMRLDIFIPKEHFGGAKNGEKVIGKITHWEPEDIHPTGEVIAVLGKPGVHETEMNAIVAEFGFASSFPEEVELEAKKLNANYNATELKNRRDFRNTLTFTIDPADAKDFDDALSFEKLNEGCFEIGIHIADVSHFVQKNSALDQEAIRRGTSVYLVDRTIPMLPEKLSNELCSLRPNEDKLSFSVVVKMNESAEVLDTWFGKTIIHSKRRFSYEEAQERIETNTGDLAEELLILNKLALQLKEKRFKKGAISFETQEVKFKLDANNKPIELFVKVRKDAHKLIEEFMLLANRKVAEFIASKNKKEHALPFVYRVHEEPNEDKLGQFNLFASRFGYHIQTSGIKAIAKSFNDLLEQVEGKPEQNLVQSQAIRTMSKAYYTGKKTMHYGLAFDHYTHFTSPIRRYPDLLAHRLLYGFLHNEKPGIEKEIEELCKQSSAMEVKAAEAERASVRYKQVEYISDFIGETFKGIISGVTEWGVYVEISQFRAEGLIKIQNLGNDYFDYDEHNKWISSRNGRHKLQLGDEIEVMVVAADIFKRQIDLAWTQSTKTSGLNKRGDGHNRHTKDKKLNHKKPRRRR